MTAEELLLNTIPDAALKRFEIDRVSFNYVKCGNPKNPSLILLHGANIGWGQWYKNIEFLSKTYEVYAIDLPGSGGSTKLDYHAMDFEKDIVVPTEKFILKLQLNPVVLVGHSIGAFIALRLALRNKISIDKLVLVEPLGLLDAMPNMYRPISFYPLALLISRTFMNTSLSSIRGFLYSSVKHIESIEEMFIEYTYESLNRDIPHPTILLMNRISGWYKIKDYFVLTSELNKISSETLVIMGQFDPMIPSFKIKNEFSRLPNAKFKLFEGASHLPFIEKTSEFHSCLKSFLKN